MSHRVVEILIGRLITDPRFRAEFVQRFEATIVLLKEQGFDLSNTEIDALKATNPRLWIRAAEDLDPRLTKVDGCV
jgi:hypothetical protein